jgi:hypothetical protein
VVLQDEEKKVGISFVEFGITGNEHLGFYYATGPHQQHPVTLDSLPPKLPRVVTRCTQQL